VRASAVRVCWGISRQFQNPKSNISTPQLRHSLLCNLHKDVYANRLANLCGLLERLHGRLDLS
jgi:hypothetical protein